MIMREKIGVGAETHTRAARSGRVCLHGHAPAGTERGSRGRLRKVEVRAGQRSRKVEVGRPKRLRNVKERREKFRCARTSTFLNLLLPPPAAGPLLERRRGTHMDGPAQAT